MKTLILLIIALTCSGFVARSAHSAPLTVQEIRGLHFFNRLNYEDPEVLKGMRELEAQLIESADQVMVLPDTDPYFKTDALTLVYAALYQDNLLDASKNGFLTFSAEDVQTRKDRIVRYVTRARPFLLHDNRIDAWYNGMRAKYLDPKYADAMIQTAKKLQDTFSLVSALIVISHIDVELTAEQKQILNDLTKKFGSLTSPCFFGKKRMECRSPPLAPFTAQTGIVMIADYRMKIAEEATSPRVRNFARITAGFLYRSAKMVWMKATTPFWMNKSIIDERLELTRARNFTPDNLENYRKTRSARAVFQCASCHTGPVNQ